ncbi:MAG: undecaprenyl-diphosphate phosphatase [Gemmatimonadales bacterium]|nr:undecaprenyl-diphosphate phosphatase [Gemmatimonadales bacterium]
MILLTPLVIALLLGLVEGITEFLPISSTGHLIVVGALLDFTGERADIFSVVIQVGAIFAVIWHYRQTLIDLLTGFATVPGERRLAGHLLLAFLPAVVLGLLWHDWIKAVLFAPTVVASALVIGGVIIIALEWRRPVVTAATIREMTWRQALLVGVAQCLAMIPGTSRSAATILGGYAVGLSRPAATAFSFLLAIPTILGAATLDLVKGYHALGAADLPLFAVGTLAAFVSALLVIRGFLKFVERHTFVAFAWYRIGFGALLFLLLKVGLL